MVGEGQGNEVTCLLVELPFRLSHGAEDSFHLIIMPDCPGQVSAHDSEKRSGFRKGTGEIKAGVQPPLSPSRSPEASTRGDREPGRVP